MASSLGGPCFFELFRSNLPLAKSVLANHSNARCIFYEQDKHLFCIQCICLNQVVVTNNALFVLYGILFTELGVENGGKILDLLAILANPAVSIDSRGIDHIATTLKIGVSEAIDLVEAMRAFSKREEVIEQLPEDLRKMFEVQEVLGYSKALPDDETVERLSDEFANAGEILDEIFAANDEAEMRMMTADRTLFPGSYLLDVLGRHIKVKKPTPDWYTEELIEATEKLALLLRNDNKLHRRNRIPRRAWLADFQALYSTPPSQLQSEFDDILNTNRMPRKCSPQISLNSAIRRAAFARNLAGDFEAAAAAENEARRFAAAAVTPSTPRRPLREMFSDRKMTDSGIKRVRSRKLMRM